MINKSKKEDKMEVREETISRYVDLCPICKIEIKGNNEKGLKYNLQIHMNAKHGAAIPSETKNE